MVDFGSAAAGAVTGGGLFGPVGAVAGGVLGLFGGKKKKKKPKPLSGFDPQQQALYNDYIRGINGEGQFADLYKFNANQANDVFDQNVARPQLRQFHENTVPEITGQYRQNNLMNSSYSGEALARAGRDLNEHLGGLRSATQFQGQQNANTSRQNAINSVLQNPTFSYQDPQASQPGMIDQILGAAGGSAGQWFSDYLNQRNQKSQQLPASVYAGSYRQQPGPIGQYRQTPQTTAGAF